MRQRQGQCPHGRGSADSSASPHLADVVLVFGDIGEVREIAESAHDKHGFAGRHAVEDGFEFAPGRPVVIPVKPDRGLADSLHQVEHVVAFLVTHGVAEDSSEQPDVIPQPGVFFKRQGFFGAIRPQLGVGRHDLGRHGEMLQKFARQVLGRNFLRPTQGQQKVIYFILLASDLAVAL